MLFAFIKKSATHEQKITVLTIAHAFVQLNLALT
jgi:hypothetical protein